MTFGGQRLNEFLECGDSSPLSVELISFPSSAWERPCIEAPLRRESSRPRIRPHEAKLPKIGVPKQSFGTRGAAQTPTLGRKAAINRRTPKGGFTLVEMLLTLAIITVVSAMAWPVLQKPIANRRLHSAADEVRTRWCKARIEAMRSGHVYAFRYQIGGDQFRTELDAASSSLAGIQTELSDASEDEFHMAGEDSIESEDMMLPEGVTFLADLSGDEGMPASLAAAETGPTAESGDWSDPILFYPDGTASDGRVVLSNDQSGAVRLSLRGITGTVTVADVDPSLE